MFTAVSASAALIGQIVLLLYLELVEWVNLYPWNDVRQGNGQGALDVVLGAVIVAAIVATYRRWRPGIIAAVGVYVIWMALQVTTFWTAYIAGARPAWQRIWAANFGRTVQWLPRVGTHLPPDANHIVLELLLLVAIVTAARSALAAPRSPTPPGSR